MAEKTDVKAEALPDLDDLLQCPVCYEIPSGQIFQCNEGHHVCGRCKARLSQCPVCRALFFGTRNYAMEELIANVKKLRAFKLGGKVTTGSSGSGSNTPAEEATSSNNDNNSAENEDENSDENGQSENGEYVQAWQFSTVPGRIVTAVRVSDMGIFFLIIEITNESVHAWLSMAAAPWVSNEFSYTVTISGNDREAIFSDCVWSVRSCEGFLKKRGRCLVVSGLDARALVAPATIGGKLSVHRVRPDEAHQLPQHPRAVLRVASRGGPRDLARDAVSDLLDPFIQQMQNDVARISREIEREIRDHTPEAPRAATAPAPAPAPPVAPPPAPGPERNLSRNARRRMRNRLRAALNEAQNASERATVQHSAAQRPNGHINVAHIGVITVQPAASTAGRRIDPPSNASANSNRRNNIASTDPIRIQTGLAIVQPSPVTSTPAARQQAQLAAALQRNVSNNPVQIQTGLAIVHHPVQNQIARSGQSNGQAGGDASAAAGPASSAAAPGGQPQGAGRTNKKKRRHRR